ncbi:MAG: response regulator [Deltaproteobacteria bacterium]|nr:MAG: response regulator [Deltaproteobacteria bacterium]
MRPSSRICLPRGRLQAVSCTSTGERMQVLELELCAALRLGDDGTVERVGVGFERILAWEARELVGKKWHEVCDEAHTERFARAYENVRSGAPSASVRARFPRYPDPVTLVSRLAREGDGFLVVCEDQTKKTANVANVSSMANLVDFAADSWFVHDLEGRIRDANSWACKNLGYTREEMLQLHVADFETTIRPGRMDGVWNRMEIGVPISVEGCQKRKDGSTFPVDVRLGLFESGDEVLMLAIARDITKLKRVEAELQEFNDALERKVSDRAREMNITLTQRQAMLDSMSDGLVAVDAEGIIELANPALGELLGGTLPHGIPAADVLPGKILQVIDEALETGAPTVGEARCPGDRICQVAASPILHDGVLDGVIARVQDVTLEREIDRMKTDFIATVSHELRTPLTSVLGFAKVTRNQLESKVFPHLDLEQKGIQRAVARVRSNIDIIRSEGERLTALINDVLDISKMESGRMEWNFAPVDVESLVSQAAEATSALFMEEPGLEVEVEEGLPAIHGDRARLLQILINLLSNAAKFARSTVRLTAFQQGGGVEFAVEDDGIGIDPALQASIFEKFKQVGNTLTDKPKGTGLGLPICQQIARAHEAEITVASDVNEGARFAFSIGVTQAKPDAASQVEALLRRIEHKVPRFDAGARDILVVDDDPNIRELLRQELSERGYTVRQAANGYEAIGQVRAQRPDLIILDVMMPELSGFDVAAMLKNDPQTESIPILILSIIEDEDRGLRLGVDRYLTKPAETEDLLEAVRDLLEQETSPRRVLVVDQNKTMTSEIARLLELRGYQVVGTASETDFIEKAREARPDLIILESILDGHEELLRTIRYEKDLEHVYIVQLVEDRA